MKKFPIFREIFLKFYFLFNIFIVSFHYFRAKFVPDFQPTIEAAALPTLPVPPDGNYSPPTPEEAERIISHLLPR